MIDRVCLRRHLCLLFILALPSANFSAETDGMAARCVFDSAYLSNADSLVFRFSGKTKSGTLDLELLAQGVSGMTFENRRYRESLLSKLGLPLVNIAGASGRAISEGAVGDEASLEVSCFRKEAAVWIGEQVTSSNALDGVTWLGQDTTLGWSLKQEGSRRAWIFVPDQPVLGLPGQIGGFQVEGELDIHVPLDTRIKLPGSLPAASRRIHLTFKPKKAIRWSCGDGACTPAAAKGQEGKSILESMARHVYIYWSDEGGWLADAAATRRDDGRTWIFQWYMPGKPGLDHADGG